MTRDGRSPESDPCSHEPHDHQPTEPAILERAAALFRSAGDSSRLRLLELLMSGEHCVTELAEELDEKMPTISERLRLLRTDGLVTRRREGKHMYYQLADEHVEAILKMGIAHASEDL